MQNQPFSFKPSPSVRIGKKQITNFDSEIIDLAYNIVEDIFFDVDFYDKMISFGMDPDCERVLLIKNLNNLEQYFSDFDHRFRMLADKDEEIFLIEGIISKEQQIKFDKFVNEYQDMLEYALDDFKNNFIDRKIDIFIPSIEFDLREENRVNHYRNNPQQIWTCSMAQSFDKSCATKSHDKKTNKNYKQRTKREGYVIKALKSQPRQTPNRSVFS